MIFLTTQKTRMIFSSVNNTRIKEHWMCQLSCSYLFALFYGWSILFQCSLYNIWSSFYEQYVSMTRKIFGDEKNGSFVDLL